VPAVLTTIAASKIRPAAATATTMLARNRMSAD